MRKIMILAALFLVYGCKTTNNKDSSAQNVFGNVDDNQSVKGEDLEKAPNKQIGNIISDIPGAIKHLCTGVILRPGNLVVTRADCLYDSNGNEYKELKFFRWVMSGGREQAQFINITYIFPSKGAKATLPFLSQGRKINPKSNWAFVLLETFPLSANETAKFYEGDRITKDQNNLRSFYGDISELRTRILKGEKTSCSLKKHLTSNGDFYHNCPTGDKYFGAPIFVGDYLYAMNVGAKGNNYENVKYDGFNHSNANVAIKARRFKDIAERIDREVIVRENLHCQIRNRTIFEQCVKKFKDVMYR